MSWKAWYVAGGLVIGVGVLATAITVAPVIARANRGGTVSSAAAAPSAAAAKPQIIAQEAPQQEGGTTSASPGQRWANSKQFMEIKTGQTRDGQVYLQVRPAQKQTLGESFVTVTVPGPYTEVAVTADARIRYLDGESGTPEAFILALAKRDPNRPNHVQPDQRKEGFDLTFDGQGRVTQVDWLYVL